jgi:hypothetical protein
MRYVADVLACGYTRLICLIRHDTGASRTTQLLVWKALCIMHENITQSSECRDFNHRAALLLERLEDAGFNRLANRAMGLLACWNPKDLSQCDNIKRARDVLEMMKELARES